MQVTAGDLPGKVVNDYALILYPLLFGIALVLSGVIFDSLGRGAEAGVAAATGIIICGIAVVVYVIYWLLGQRSV